MWLIIKDIFEDFFSLRHQSLMESAWPPILALVAIITMLIKVLGTSDTSIMLIAALVFLGVFVLGPIFLFFGKILDRLL